MSLMGGPQQARLKHVTNEVECIEQDIRNVQISHMYGSLSKVTG